jgi:asparagine synthetase B (glutamine-hydrolysing)
VSNPQVLCAENAIAPQIDSRWVGILTPGKPIDLTTSRCEFVAGKERSKKLYVRYELNSAPPSYAERAGCGVVFDGILYDRARWERELGTLPPQDSANDAEVVLSAYQKWGEKIFTRLRGTFALVVWDSRNETLMCLRDPTGIYSLFYSETGEDFLVSSTMEVLVRQPKVSAALNTEALSDFFLDRFPMMDETFFRDAKRVPPGHILRVTRDRHESYRYWDPAPDGVVKWLAAEELEQFDDLLNQAISRPFSLGPSGILLSGGFDSVSVAAGAVQCAEAIGLPRPLALSLVFPEADVNEEVLQRRVASQLGLPQVLKGFWEAAGPRGMLPGAVELNKLLPAPIINAWWPVYNALVGEGYRQGCRVILTGTGGDEWLGVAPILATDLMRDLDFAGLFRLWKMSWRSFTNPRIPLLKTLLWTFGVGPLITAPTHKLVKKIAPWALPLRRRIFHPMPRWLAPDKRLRRRLQERWEEKSVKETHADPSGSFYLQQVKLGLDHPLVSWESEEQFEFSRMAGVRIVHPLWDPDLVDMLYRTPPLMLIHNGRNKGLFRASLERKFPDLGFERQKKMAATRFYSSVIYKEAQGVWDQLRGAPTLAALGVIDGKHIDSSFRFLLKRRRHGDAHRAWCILNLESWARAHS